jgi:hypothetical protein
MFSIQADTSNLEAAIFEFSKASRQGLKITIKKQAGILVAHLIALTPPAGGRAQAMNDDGAVTLEAKKRGEARIAADIIRLFPTSKIKHDKLLNMVRGGYEWTAKNGRKTIVRQVAETAGELRKTHQFARNPKSGRTRLMGGLSMAITRSRVLKEYIKQEKAKVGLLSAGWIRAANELKTTSRAVPSWIKRHGAKAGGVNISDRIGMVGIRIYNNQAWFPSDMTGRVQDALRRRERGLQAALADLLERNAAKAQERMR